MGNIASRGPLPLRFSWPRMTTAATLVSCVTWVLLLAGTVHALDPNRRLTQYIHKSWRIEDGSAPAAMFSIAQTSDGFLWFSAQGQGMYRFDGVQFLPRPLSLNGRTINPVVNVFGDRAGGLWAFAENQIVLLKAGVTTAQFALPGLWGPNNGTRGPDGSLWVIRADDASPLCRVTDHELKCFGTRDGITMPSGGIALAVDKQGGFWLGGQRSVIHWHEGVSQTYPIQALKSNTGQGVAALAVGEDGTIWVGLLPQGRGWALGDWYKACSSHL